MFNGRYFAARYFAPRYFPKVGAAAPVVLTSRIQFTGSYVPRIAFTGQVYSED